MNRNKFAKCISICPLRKKCERFYSTHSAKVDYIKIDETNSCKFFFPIEAEILGEQKTLQESKNVI